MGSKVKDLTGQVFGRLVVVRQDGWYYKPNSSGGRAARWLCKCSCGTTTTVVRGDLVSGATKSCGCLKKELHMKPQGEASLQGIYQAYTARAKRKDHVFAMTKQRFKEVTSQDCYYCGAPPSPFSIKETANGAYVGNGIDRVDNSRGYVEGNIVPCCTACNRAKGAMPQEEFFNLIGRIHEKHLRSE